MRQTRKFEQNILEYDIQKFPTYWLEYNGEGFEEIATVKINSEHLFEDEMKTSI